MNSFEWSTTYEEFVDGFARWYAVPRMTDPAVAESDDRLIEEIWALDFALGTRVDRHRAASSQGFLKFSDVPTQFARVEVGSAPRQQLYERSVVPDLIMNPG
jgi:hypothetical protein